MAIATWVWARSCSPVRGASGGGAAAFADRLGIVDPFADRVRRSGRGGGERGAGRGQKRRISRIVDSPVEKLHPGGDDPSTANQ